MINLQSVHIFLIKYFLNEWTYEKNKKKIRLKRLSNLIKSRS